MILTKQQAAAATVLLSSGGRSANFDTVVVTQEPLGTVRVNFTYDLAGRDEQPESYPTLADFRAAYGVAE